MSDVLSDPSAVWAALLIVVLPLCIIGIGEVEERLRQRDSPLRETLTLVRVWVVPLAALWALTLALFDIDRSNFFVQLVGTGVVLAVAAALWSALRVFVTGLDHRPRSAGRRAVPRLLLALPRLGLILVTLWLLLAGVWEVDLSAVLTALGVTSLVVSFALQDTLSGIASGFLLLSDAPFKPGDWIKVEELEGRVVDVNWRSTRIADRNGDLVVVPNGHLAGAVLVNFDQPARLHRLVVELQVAFANPPTLAIEMLLDAARSTPGVLAEPSPAVHVIQIDDPLMGYEVHMWIDDYAIAPAVRARFGSLVWYQSHRHNVPLPSPAQDLYLYDGKKIELESHVGHTELRDRLRGSPLLAELEEDVLDRLASASIASRFAAGETITVEQTSRDLYLLHSGTAQLRLRDGTSEIDVLQIGPGELFGVLEPSERGRYRQVVVASSDCEVVVIAADAAGAVISTTPALSDAIEQLQSIRRRRSSRALRRSGVAAGDPGS